MECLKVDLRKVNFNENATWNVFHQFGIDIYKLKNRFKVVQHYMPQEEQDKLLNYLIKNYKKLKQYKGTKEYIRKTISWEVLGYFPTSVKKQKGD